MHTYYSLRLNLQNQAWCLSCRQWVVFKGNFGSFWLLTLGDAIRLFSCSQASIMCQLRSYTMVFLCLSRCVFIYSSQKFQSMRIIIFVLQLKITEGLRQIVLEHGILAFKFSPSLPGPFTKSNTPPDPCHIHLLARLCFLLKKFFDSTLMKLTPLSPFALHFFFFPHELSALVQANPLWVHL